MATERTYNIPLRKAFSKAPNYRRTERAVNELRRFVQHHMKCENVKLGKYLNLEMWKHGRKNPPVKIQVKVLKDKHKVKDKDVEYVLAELVDKEFDLPKKDDKKGKKAEKKEEKKETLEQHVHGEADKQHKEEAKAIEKEEIKLAKEELPKEIPQVEPAEFKPKAAGKLRQEEHFPRSQKPVHEKGK
mgnify:CR=1 FL=1